MEMPMSPTLHEIGSSGAEISANKPLLVETFLGRLPNGKESIVTSSSSDAIDVEISSNQLKDRSFGISRVDLLHEDEGPADSFDILGNRRGTCNTMDSGKVSDGRTRDPGSDLDTEMLNIPSSRYEGLKFPIEGELGSTHELVWLAALWTFKQIVWLKRSCVLLKWKGKYYPRRRLAHFSLYCC
jgi:hypothetical protein